MAEAEVGAGSEAREHALTEPGEPQRTLDLGQSKGIGMIGCKRAV